VSAAAAVLRLLLALKSQGFKRDFFCGAARDGGVMKVREVMEVREVMSGRMSQ
jgi:hypothetical protein